MRIRVRNAHQRVEFEVLKNGQNGSKTRGMLARVSKMSLILNVLTRAYSTIKKEAVKKESSYKLKKIMTNHKFFLKVPIFGIAKIFTRAQGARVSPPLFYFPTLLFHIHFWNSTIHYQSSIYGIPLFHSRNYGIPIIYLPFLTRTRHLSPGTSKNSHNFNLILIIFNFKS